MSVQTPDAERISDLTVILTTTETDDQARTLASGLLQAGLAACVQCSRIDSLYVWEGAVQSDPEVRVMIKTRRSLREEALAWLRGAHPYEVPQLVCLDADAVDGPYQDWVEEVTAGG